MGNPYIYYKFESSKQVPYVYYWGTDSGQLAYDLYYKMSDNLIELLLN
jgi:hypothetical protein